LVNKIRLCRKYNISIDIVHSSVTLSFAKPFRLKCVGRQTTLFTGKTPPKKHNVSGGVISINNPLLLLCCYAQKPAGGLPNIEVNEYLLMASLASISAPLSNKGKNGAKIMANVEFRTKNNLTLFQSPFFVRGKLFLH
jgi:hypothetical protein